MTAPAKRTTWGELFDRLRAIDRRPYGAYRSLEGVTFAGPGDVEVTVDRVASDPFAPPSRLHVRAPNPFTVTDPVAAADLLARALRTAAEPYGLRVDAGGQEILDRTACRIDDDAVEFRLGVVLPAAGRQIRGDVAAALLTEHLPDAVAAAVATDPAALANHEAAALRQRRLRSLLGPRGLVAFVGDGAILPRAAGDSDLPLAADAVPFESPPELAVELDGIRGMGVPAGVTLIAGGGFHGKSTLLSALERGVFDHIPGDGRELVVTRADAVKVRAEDGRAVTGVDLSAFIGPLPGGRSTTAFTTSNASGSTSQAAAIVEALEVGTGLLLFDEDTSATNLLVSDAAMRELIGPGGEPIVPLIDHAVALHRRGGVSTVLVMGGSAAYLAVADEVLLLRDFRVSVVTDRARALAPAAPPPGEITTPVPPTPRAVADVGWHKGLVGRRARPRARGRHELDAAGHRVDLRALAGLVDASQTRAVAALLAHAVREEWLAGAPSVADLCADWTRLLDDGGLDVLGPPGQRPREDLARPRPHEIAGALNRLRTLTVRTRGVDP